MSHPGIELITTYLSESGFGAGTIAEQREAMARMVGAPPAPDGVGVETMTLGGRRAERLTPEAAKDGTVFYLHGGGYCTGSLDSHRGLAGRIALAARCQVVTLDYRLAPEHPHPAGLTDALAAYSELLASGLRPERMAIAGDSAGGGLTMATLVALRDQGGPMPAAGVCLSPWVDLTQSAPSYATLGPDDPMITKAGLDLYAHAYLAGAPATTPLASPLFADDLSGLPPMFVEVGAREALLDDATRLADRLQEAGGTVSLTIWPELIHVFQAFPGNVVPEADQSIDAIAAFLAHHLALAGAASRQEGSA
jgi:monoterpene epsilon-lactone hydrolase